MTSAIHVILSHSITVCIVQALQFNYAVEFHEPDTPWKFNVNTLARLV